MVKRVKRRGSPILAGVDRERVEAMLARLKTTASEEYYERVRAMAESVLALREMSDDELRELIAKTRRRRGNS